MTKAEIVDTIAKSTGMEKNQVSAVVEAFMKEVKSLLSSGESVFLRGFGTFLTKHRAAKAARNIAKNTTMIVPAHTVPAFKPSKEFVKAVKGRD